MKKLTLEHLAPYLPYDIELAFVLRDEIRYVGKITSLLDIQEYDDIKIKIGYNDAEHIWMFKPILHPLSDLTKEIEHNGEKFVPVDIFFPYSDYDKIFDRKVDITSLELAGSINFKYSPYFILNNLFKWHFDVFGLIDAGLAVDENTLEGGSSNG